MQYFSVNVSVDAENKQMLQYQFHSLGATGILEEDEGFVAYFNNKTYDGNSLNETLESLTEFYEFDFELESFEDKNWNAEWESNYKPIFVKNYCAIYAPFHKREGKYKHELIINPEMAFGTGHHETTQLMIEQLISLDLKNKTVLDLGSGTGILAIIAKKEEAKEVVAVDIDPQAVKIMKENFITNHVLVDSELGTSEDIKNQYDVILANINRNVLLDESEKISSLVKQGGLLILSGFYNKDNDLLKEKYEYYGMLADKKLTKNSWCSLIFKK